MIRASPRSPHVVCELSQPEAVVASSMETLGPTQPGILVTPALEGVPGKKGSRCGSRTVTAENPPELVRAETCQIPDTRSPNMQWVAMITGSKFLLRLDPARPQDPGRDRALVRVERRVCWFTEQPEDKRQTLLLPTCSRGRESRRDVRARGCPPLGSRLTPASGCRGVSSRVLSPIRLLPPAMCWAAPVGPLPRHAPRANPGRQEAERQQTAQPQPRIDLIITGAWKRFNI